MKKNDRNVVSGQQCAFLGGPFFIANKIISACYLAKKKKRSAIFWVETNDSDFNEVSQTSFIDAKGQVQQIKLKRSAVPLPNGFRIGDIPTNDAFLATAEKFFNALTKTSHTKKIKDIAMQSYTECSNMGTATISILQKLFVEDKKIFDALDTSLRFFDPRDEKFLEFCKPFLLKEAFSKTLKQGEQCPFFAFINQSRQAVFKDKDFFKTRSGEKIDLEKTTLLPHLLSRSILQDAYLNADFYVAGPSEMIYLKKLEKRYHLHGVKQSKLVKRMKTVLLSANDERDLRELTMAIKKKNALKKIDENVVLDKFLHLEKNQLDKYLLSLHLKFDADHYRKLLKKAKQNFVDELLKMEAAPSLVKKIERKIYLEQKHILGQKRQEAKKNLGKIFEIKNRLMQNLKPEQDQERAYSLFYFLNHYGTDLLKSLIENASIENASDHEKILRESEINYK